MARDYKNTATNRRKRAVPQFSGGTGLAIGLVTGVALAAGVHLYHVSGTQDDPSGPGDADTGSAEQAPGDAARPRFDFYRLLPNYEVVIPEEDIEVATVEEQAELQAAGNYVLQAGSFRNAADADRLRAELALLGIVSRVQTITIDDDDTWHRVRIGPMRDLDEINNTRQRLAANDIDALVIRVGD